jgi:hypothetical protein
MAKSEHAAKLKKHATGIKQLEGGLEKAQGLKRLLVVALNIVDSRITTRDSP